jgi:hypothetical protein
MSNKNISNNIFESPEQLVISYELLCLLQWLVEHDIDKMQRIIDTALKKGLYKKVLNKNNRAQFQSFDQAQHAVTEFFTILEALLIDKLSIHQAQELEKRDCLPEIDRIDTKNYDQAMVQTSIDKATKNAQKSDKSAQELLFQELLRRWKPGKNSTFN